TLPKDFNGWDKSAGDIFDQAAAQQNGEQFKQQAWSQAGQHLRSGNIIGAAKDIGSLFTSANPAAVEAGKQLRSVLPQSEPQPQSPAGSMEEFQKLPKDQQNSYIQQLEDWKARQGAASMQTALGFATPGTASNAASAAKDVIQSVRPSAIRESAGALFNAIK